MRVPVQIISFSCFLFSVTVVRGQEFRCGIPRDQQVADPHSYFSGERTLGTKKNYYCWYGSEYKSGVATCTRDGWTPKPLCAGKMCAAPNIPNAEILEYQRSEYNTESRIRYQCHPGFEPEQHVYITCNSRTEWTGIQQCTGKMCAAPNIPNAEILGDQRPEYNINSRIQYKCRPGFEPEQPVEITCNFRTEWADIQQCTAKQLCPDPSVENGLIHTLPSNEEEIFYTCDTGYKPFHGNWWDSVTCSRGSWSEKPRCIREEECGALPSVHQGKLKIIRQIQGTAELECDPGFKPTQRFIRCVSGTWETPVCEVDVHCDIPPKVKNALITSKPKEFYGYGSSVTYVCRSSFLMKGKSTVFCRSGTWEEAPTCKEATCPLNTADEDLIMERSPDIEGPVKPGHKLIFSCNREGLKLKGQSEITCQSNGEWSRPFPKCEEVMCFANLKVNMRSDGHPGPEVSVRPGHTITLSCVGRELQGQSKIRCLSDGQWDVPFPKCVGEAMCPLNPTDENLIMERSPDNERPVKHGDKLSFSCREGLKLKGQREITCQPNGQWSSPFPKCEAETTGEATCPLNPTDKDLIMKRSPDIVGPVKPGHKLIFSCNREGLKLKGQRKITCQSNGEWSRPFPTCEAENTDGKSLELDNTDEVMCVATLTENMRSDVTDDGHPGPEISVRSGRTITLSCLGTGVKLQGDKKISCLSNGEWNVPFPKCIREATCPLNPTDKDLIMERSPDIVGPVKPGHKLIFSCNREGLKLKGQSEITCQSNGEWSRPFPKCEEVMCFANLKVNMRSDGHPGPEVSVRPGHTITLSCVGRELQGQSKIRCLSDGQWDVPFPKCVGGKCGPPPNVNFADTKEMTKNEYNSEERVEYTCFNKYTLVQSHPYSKYLTCEDGEWRGEIKCLKPCSVTVEVMDERGLELRWRGREKIFSSHGDRITFSCKSGKYSVGSDLIQICNDGEIDLPLCD